MSYLKDFTQLYTEEVSHLNSTGIKGFDCYSQGVTHKSTHINEQPVICAQSWGLHCGTKFFIDNHK